MRKTIKAINYLLAILFAVFAVAIAYMAIPAFGNQALIVRSGSMAPAIGVGDLVVVKIKQAVKSPQATVPVYHVGDVIAFKSASDPKTLTTHRVVAIEQNNGSIFYKTKGDANKAQDENLIKEQSIVGREMIILPKVGRLLAFAKSQRGFPLLVIFPAFLVILIESTNIYREVKKQKSLVQVPQKQVSPIIPIQIIIVVAISTLLIRNSFAYFSDVATSQNNIFAVAQAFASPTPTPSPTPSPSSSPSPSPSPSPTINAGDVVINEIMWMGTQGDAADEWIELRNMTGNTIDLSNWVVDNLGSGVTNDIEIPLGKSILPNGFFFIANDTKATGNHNVDPDLVVNVSLLNPGEQLRLRTSAGGTIIDTADDAGNGWFAGVDPGGQNPERSMERNDIPGDGTVSSNWHSATTAVNMDLGEREIATPRVANSAP